MSARVMKKAFNYLTPFMEAETAALNGDGVVSTEPKYNGTIVHPCRLSCSCCSQVKLQLCSCRCRERPLSL